MRGVKVFDQLWIIRIHCKWTTQRYDGLSIYLNLAQTIFNNFIIMKANAVLLFMTKHSTNLCGKHVFFSSVNILFKLYHYNTLAVNLFNLFWFRYPRICGKVSHYIVLWMYGEWQNSRIFLDVQASLIYADHDGKLMQLDKTVSFHYVKMASNQQLVLSRNR